MNPNKLNIQVLIPVYNTEKKYLDKCLSSVLNQTYQDWHCIICDDCSTDPQTLEVLKKYTELDPRFTLIYNEINMGVGKSSDKLLDNTPSDTDYICFIDSDDYIEENYIQEAVDKILEYPEVDIIKFGYKYESSFEEPNPEEHPMFDTEPGYYNSIDDVRAIAYKDFPVRHKQIIRFEIIEQNNIRCHNVKIFEDYIFAVQLIHHITSMYVLDKCLYHYVQRPTSICHTKMPTHGIGAFIDTVQTYLDKYDDPKHLDFILNKFSWFDADKAYNTISQEMRDILLKYRLKHYDKVIIADNTIYSKWNDAHICKDLNVFPFKDIVLDKDNYNKLTKLFQDINFKNYIIDNNSITFDNKIVGHYNKKLTAKNVAKIVKILDNAQKTQKYIRIRMSTTKKPRVLNKTAILITDSNTEDLNKYIIFNKLK